MATNLIPDNAPFTEEQRDWLNGFLAGLLNLDGRALTPLPEEEEYPWHDPELELKDRMELAEGRPFELKLMAAMAQLDCGQCGYLCRTYSKAIADGEEPDLTRCVPGGKVTARKLKELVAEPGAVIIPNLGTTIPKTGTYSRKNPFNAKLKEIAPLVQGASIKDTRHIVIDLSGSDITYEPGDSLGVFPCNDPDLVSSILNILNATGDELAGDLSVRQALLEVYNITNPSDECIELLASSATNSTEAGHLKALMETVQAGQDLLDLLEEHPSARPTITDLVVKLDLLQPRLYSISSSLKMHKDEVHLTIGVVRYKHKGRERRGVASTFFADQIQPGGNVKVYIQPAHAFYLPKDNNTPIIMVGPGTGVAPFRAFLQERKLREAKGKNWLFFGNPNVSSDFFYQYELKSYLEDGLLTRLDTAFSRDQKEKIYVQHRMLENSVELWKWLQEGAYFYVCGDATRMAKDVDGALHQICMEAGGLSDEEATNYVKKLTAEGRYLKDVYETGASFVVETDSTTFVKTTCPYCGVGCGVLAKQNGNGIVEVKGDPQHPANYGRLCSKGDALGETVDLEGRLLYPQVHNQRVSWDEALTFISEKLTHIIKEHGPKAVAFYVSGQLLTEDYYVANKLMKGFVGVANIDTNSRLCMSSAVSGHKRAFGSDTVPCSYEDLELAELIVLVGSNTAWCHPVAYQRILAARKQHQQNIVVIDPRYTSTCGDARLHLPIKPGTDTVLFNGLLYYLYKEGVVDQEFIEKYTNGFQETIETISSVVAAVPYVAVTCGLKQQDVEDFYAMFANTERVITLFSQGVNQSSGGVDKVNSIINCHLATGRIGKAGAGPFSITGQPNAMGGREVGGLSNQLAAHMELEDPTHRDIVQRFWKSPFIPKVPGYKAVDLFDAIEEGKIKAVWIMATNPAVSLPNTNWARKGLKNCELVIVSDCIQETDTTSFAHVLLPAAAWGEKDGTVTNSERCISRVRAFLTPPEEVKPDWWIITQVAQHMGFAEAFPYNSPGEIFREHAALSGFENTGVRARDFNISGLSKLSDEDYTNFQPRVWPITEEPTQRFFSDGRFFHTDRKAHFIAVSPTPPQYPPDKKFPLILNTGRVRDHWHTLTRTGKSPRLSLHMREPFMEIHPQDAVQHNIDDSAFAQITSRWGKILVRARITEKQQVGCVFVPIHWNDNFSSSACVGSVVNPATDPISGQPESKYTPVKVEPIKVGWEGFLLTRNELNLPTMYWCKTKGQDHWQYDLADSVLPESWSSWAMSLFNVSNGVHWLQYQKAGTYRAAWFDKETLQACLFVDSTHTQLTGRAWLASLFSQTTLKSADRDCLLTRAHLEEADPTICSCWNVGQATILNAIREQKLDSVEAIGAALNAGTNCGSCIPELKTLLHIASRSISLDINTLT